MKSILPPIVIGAGILGCAQSNTDDGYSAPIDISKTYHSIYWSDGDSGRLGDLKFRLADLMRLRQVL